MAFGSEYILVTIGGILAGWVLNNASLREGTTEWFVTRLGIGQYDVSNHHVKETLKKLKFEARLTEFDNVLKTELFHYYTDIVLDNMNDLVNDILSLEKKLSLEETKKMIKNSLYDKLTIIQNNIDSTIKMPIALQNKFDKFINYLSLQHTYAIENALQSSNKKLLMFQVLDAIDNNNRWFLFYSQEMYQSFNGGFDTLSKKDIFIKK